MKFESSTKKTNNIRPLTPLLQEELNQYRLKRNFNVEEYLDIKSHIINDYFRKSGLNTAVVAVSGGIDSSIVLAILMEASKKQDSPIQNIIPVAMPVEKYCEGVTYQKEATELARKLCFQLGYKLINIDLSDIFLKIIETFEKTMPDYYQDNKRKSINRAWSEGQLIPYLRTCLLYYLTNIYTDKDMKALLVGTTNRDEISYIGFFGKASDGMVDIQPISDLHKSEVYKVAEYFKLPKEIISRKPNGDMYHGRDDESFFGFTYDFLELYTHYLSLDKLNQYRFISKFHLDKESHSLFKEYSDNVERLHLYNAHKYPLRSPAIHLDLYDSLIIPEMRLVSDKTKFVGLNDLKTDEEDILLNFKDKQEQTVEHSLIKDKNIYEIKNFLNKEESVYLLEINKTFKKEAANVYGVSHNKHPRDTSFGSLRSSFYSEKLANNWYKRLIPLIPNFKVINESDVYDGLLKNEVWKLVGMAPYFRFINYYHDNWLVPHYDSPFVYDKDTMTLMSVVFSLTTNDTGETVFIDDTIFKRKNHKETVVYDDFSCILNNSYADYDDLFDSDILIDLKHKTINHEADSITIFDHRILHQVNKIQNENKTIIRTDLIFKKVY